MLTILHLSDLHFGSGERRTYGSDAINAGLLEDCVRMRRRLGSPHLIALTGDVSYSADAAEEFWNAAKWVTSLCERVEVQRDKVFVVPGNHDVNRRELRSKASKTARAHLRGDPSVLDQYLDDLPKTHNLLWPKLEAYSRFARSVCGAPAIDARQPYWEVPLDTPPGRIRLVGLNTVLLSFGDDDGPSSLRLGLRQLGCVADATATGDLHIVLAHHPPEWLLDGKELNGLLQSRPHLLMCGHVHEQDASLHVSFGQGGLLRFASGAAGLPGGDSGGHAYAWITLGREGLMYYPRIWSGDGGFVADLRHCDEARDHSVHHVAALPSPLRAWLSKRSAPLLKQAEGHEVPSSTSAGEDEFCGIARGSMLAAVPQKRHLGLVALQQLKTVLDDEPTIYFGPGTTIYYAFIEMWQSARLRFEDVRVITSNDWILGFLRKERAWLADQVEIVGRRLLSEYGSWVLPANEEFPTPIDVAIVGISGVDFTDDIDLRTCWQDQVRTVNLACRSAKRITLFLADARKLVTSAGSSFIGFGKVAGTQPPPRGDRSYRLVVDTSAAAQSQTFVHSCDKLNRILGVSEKVGSNVSTWSWSEGGGVMVRGASQAEAPRLTG